MLRRELAEQRWAIAEVPRLRQENHELREKVQRQEAYLRRRIVKERAAATGGSTGDPALVAAARAAASEIFASLDAHAAATAAYASPRQSPSAAAAALVQAHPKAPGTTTPGAAITVMSPRASAALTAVAALMGSPSRAGYATPSKTPLLHPGGSSSSSSSPSRLLLPSSSGSASARRGNKENSFSPHLALPFASPAPAADPIAAAAAAMERLGVQSSHLTPSRRDGVGPPPPPAGAVMTRSTAATSRLAQLQGPSPARLKLMIRSPGTRR